MVQLRVGGVPEHFNLPWHLAIEKERFLEAGLEVTWQDFPGGTGAMTKALRAGDIDLAALLTEGMVADIHKGNDSEILQFFIQSPLRWGIYVGAQTDYQKVEDLKGKKYAISRFGSGSHLMSFVSTKSFGWNPETDIHFEVVKNLDGARKALTSGTADGFMWEKYMTQPYVDNGEFRKIGEFPTPWPCFVIAARKQAMQDHPIKIHRLLQVINKECMDFMQHPQAPEMISKRYNLKLEDTKKWFSETEWSASNDMDESILEEVRDVVLDFL